LFGSCASKWRADKQVGVLDRDPVRLYRSEKQAWEERAVTFFVMALFVLAVPEPGA
jgi:hypothetical protein